MQESSASAVARAAIDLRQFPLIRRLAVDYVYRFEALAEFYAGDPRSGDAWRQAIAGAREHPRDRDALVSILHSQQERRRAPERARAAAAALSDPASVAVVTGQQAGLFGGPLFTLLKALTTLKLAHRTSERYGVAAVPVFWIDAEDHDWKEVASVTVLDAELTAKRVTLADPRGAGELPVGALRLDEDVRRALDDLRGALSPSEFTDGLVADLAAAYAPGAGIADAFGRWLEGCLGSFGLVVFDSSDPSAKPLARHVFRRELEAPGRAASLAAGAGAALAARGYHAQVSPQPDAVSLFHLDPGRRPIRRAGDRFLLGDRQESAASLAALAERAPHEFSPNVLLRPIVQDTLFPTACYVSGPSELAYLGQLRGVYAQFGVPMPLMYPRAMATVLDSGAARFLARYDVPFEGLQPQDEAWLNRLLEAQLPPHVEASLDEARRAIHDRMEAVVEAIPAIDPTLERAARSTLGKMEHDLRVLHGKVIHAAKRRDETLRRQFIRARAQAFPGGHLQERELGYVFFLNRYGPALIDVLMSDLPLEPGQHWILTP